MKLLATGCVCVVVALSIVNTAWGAYQYEKLRKEAPWLIVPEPTIVDVEQFPWQAAVIADDSSFCAGSLLTLKWVMTAAHCTSNHKVFDLAIGSTQEVRQTTRKVNQHPDYQPESQENDLALLELPNDVSLSQTVGVIHLPTSDITLNGMDLLVTGWDSLEDRLSIWAAVSTPPLKSIQVHGVPDKDCYATYGQSFSERKICIGTTSSPHVEGVLALADGGSPVVLVDRDGKYVQVGVLSSGPGHSTLRPPVIAMKLSSFLSWIQTVTGISTPKNK